MSGAAASHPRRLANLQAPLRTGSVHDTFAWVGAVANRAYIY